MKSACFQRSFLLKILFLFFIINCMACSDDVELEPDPPTVCELILDSIKINQLQIIGSHNSYRLRTFQPIFDLVIQLAGVLPDDLNPEGWDYTHLSLPEQLNEYGMRSFELDIYHDPLGGRFYERKANPLVNEPAESGIPELLEPGMKIIHISDVDYETNYYTFKSALQALKDWSDINPRHIPLFILVEPKEDGVGQVIPSGDFTTALPFTPSALDSIDMEIKEIFGENLDKVITPDRLRGDFASVNEAVLAGAWPTLEEARGKFFFILDGSRSAYLEGHTGLEGRVMFVYSSAGNPETAFIIQNGPLGSEDFIRSRVEEGYMVRTRADADTREARTGDISRREAAFASGAQIISTDYYRADPRADTSSAWTDYSVAFPTGETARLNPVNNILDDMTRDCEIEE